MVQRCFLTLVCPSYLITFYLGLICSAEFISPASVRSAIRKEQGNKYRVRKEAQLERAGRKEGMRREENELAVSKVFA